MSTFWLEYAIFPILLFFLGVCLVTGLPLAAEYLHWRERRRVKVALPETKQAKETAFATAR
jgi:hypothetical protein